MAVTKKLLGSLPCLVTRTYRVHQTCIKVCSGMTSCVALVAFVRVDAGSFLCCLKLGFTHLVDRFLGVRLAEQVLTQEVPSDTIFCVVFAVCGLFQER